MLWAKCGDTILYNYIIFFPFIKFVVKYCIYGRFLIIWKRIKNFFRRKEFSNQFLIQNGALKAVSFRNAIIVSAHFIFKALLAMWEQQLFLQLLWTTSCIFKQHFYTLTRSHTYTQFCVSERFSPCVCMCVHFVILLLAAFRLFTFSHLAYLAHPNTRTHARTHTHTQTSVIFYASGCSGTRRAM